MEKEVTTKLLRQSDAISFRRVREMELVGGLVRRTREIRGCIFTVVIICLETYYDRACNAALGACVI